MPLRLKLPRIRKIPDPGLVFILGVTVIYLLIEFAFNAHLLDVMSSQASPARLDRIEDLGKLISGFAVALACLPLVLIDRTGRIREKRGWVGMAKRTIAAIAVTAGTMYLTYQFEGKLIDVLTDRSSPAQRKEALATTLYKQSKISKDSSKLPPDEKVLLSILPLIATTSPGRIQVGTSDKRRIYADSLDERGGDLDAEYERFNHSQKEIRDIFRLYQESSVSYAKALGSSPEVASKAWTEYLDELKKKNPNWGPNFVGRKSGNYAPFWANGRIRKQLIGRDILVGSNWKTGDRVEFNAAVAASVRRKADIAFNAGAAKLGIEPGLSPGLSWAKFSVDPYVQRSWKSMLGYPTVDIQNSTWSRSRRGARIPAIFLPGESISRSQFEAVIFNPIREVRVNLIDRSYTANELELVSGGRYEHSGKAAYRALIVPPLALSFSIAGILVHILKFGFLVVEIVFGWSIHRTWLKTGVIVICVGVIFRLAPHVNQAYPVENIPNQRDDRGDIEQFKTIHADWRSRSGERITSAVIDGVLNLEMVGWPVFVRAKPILDNWI